MWRFMSVHLHAQTAVHMHLTNHGHFDHGKPKYPQVEPHARIKMAQILRSPGLYLWVYHRQCGISYGSARLADVFEINNLVEDTHFNYSMNGVKGYVLQI